MSVLERIYYLHDRIRAGDYPTTRVLVETFEISPATAYRDVAYLRDRLLAPLAFDARKNGYFYTEAFSLPFEDSPAMALILGLLGNLAAESGLEDLPELRHLEERLRALLFPGQRSVSDLLYCEWIEKEPIGKGIFGRVLDALRQQRQMEISYRDSRGRSSRRVVDPLKLINYQGRWYLLAWCGLRRERRMFHLARITWAGSKEEGIRHLPAPEDDWLAESFGIFKGPARFTARIRFTGLAADLVRHQVWHPEQRLEEKPDGLILSLPAADDRELIMKILQFGARAEVLAPAELRRKLARETAAAARVYGSPLPETG